MFISNWTTCWAVIEVDANMLRNKHAKMLLPRIVVAFIEKIVFKKVTIITHRLNNLSFTSLKFLLAVSSRLPVANPPMGSNFSPALCPQMSHDGPAYSHG